MSDQEYIHEHLNVLCPGCQSKLDLSGQTAGSDINCPACNKAFKVPAEPEAAKVLPIVEDYVHENLRVLCPGCQSKLDLSGQVAGSEINCPSCETLISVPDAPSGATKTKTKKKSKAKSFSATPNPEREPRARNRKKKSSLIPAFILLLIIGAGGASFLYLDEIKAHFEAKRLEDLKAEEARILREDQLIAAMNGKKLSPLQQKREAERLAFEEANRPLTPEEMAALSQILRPDNLDFDAIHKKANKYLGQLKGQEKITHSKILEIVSRFAIETGFSLDQYSFLGNIYLKGTKKFRGQISITNENEILISREGKKNRIVTWDQFEPKQFLELTEFFATREADSIAIGADNSDTINKVAHLYKNLAFYHFWYGDNSKALKFKEDAMSFNKDIEHINLIIELAEVEKKADTVTTVPTKTDDSQKSLEDIDVEEL